MSNEQQKLEFQNDFQMWSALLPLFSLTLLSFLRIFLGSRVTS